MGKIFNKRRELYYLKKNAFTKVFK